MLIPSNININKLFRKSVLFFIFFNKHQTAIQNKKNRIFRKQPSYKQTSRFLVVNTLKKENQLNMYNKFFNKLELFILLSNRNTFVSLHLTNLITKILLELLILAEQSFPANSFYTKIYKKSNNWLYLVPIKKEINSFNEFFDKKKLNICKIENKYLIKHFDFKMNVLSSYLIFTTIYFFNAFKQHKLISYMWL